MAQIHRLPGPSLDDRRLIDVTLGELCALIAAEVQKATAQQEPEAPLGVKELGKLYGVDEKRVREWMEAGMPHIRTGDQRGLRIWPDRARAWLEQNRG
jgi:hypothetical protein